MRALSGALSVHLPLLVAMLSSAMALRAAEPSATASNAAVGGAMASQAALQSQFVFEARILVDKPHVVGQSSYGLRRVIPIAGGSFAGPGIKGGDGAGWC